MKTIPTNPLTAFNILSLILASGALLVLAGCGDNEALRNKIAQLEQKVDELSEQNHQMQIKVLALQSGQQQPGMPGLLPAPAKPATYAEALSVLQEKEIRNRVLFKLKQEEFVPSFLQVMGTQYTGQLNALSQRRLDMEAALRNMEDRGMTEKHPKVVELRSALDLVNDRLLEEITSQKKAMEVDVQILREQVEAKKDEEEK